MWEDSAPIYVDVFFYGPKALLEFDSKMEKASLQSKKPLIIKSYDAVGFKPIIHSLFILNIKVGVLS